MTPPPLVLASASPRRAELLRAAGIAFEVRASAAPELAGSGLGLAELVSANARAKALEVAEKYPASVVIGADTLVWLDGRPLGKPSGPDDARRMLMELSGRTHEVATGVHLARLEPLLQVEFVEVSRVRFRRLDEAAVAGYLARVDALDKAGAYALQEHGEMLVERVEGSRSNVVGLPVERTLAALRRFAG